MTDSKQGFEEWLRDLTSEMEGEEKLYFMDVVILKSAYQAGREHQREVDARILETTRGEVNYDGQIATIMVNAKKVAKAIREND